MIIFKKSFSYLVHSKTLHFYYYSSVLLCFYHVQHFELHISVKVAMQIK